MKYGYARTSTDDQNADFQIAALKKAGCKLPLFKDEELSEATTKRPGLLRCLKSLERGDTLVEWKLDRLGRSLRDLIAMLDDLKQRGVLSRRQHGLSFGNVCLWIQHHWLSPSQPWLLRSRRA